MGRDTTGAAIRDAAQRIRVEKSKNAHKKLLIVCGTVIVCVLLVCLTMMACVAVWSQQETIREQQYALNAQCSAGTGEVSLSCAGPGVASGGWKNWRNKKRA